MTIQLVPTTCPECDGTPVNMEGSLPIVIHVSIFLSLNVGVQLTDNHLPKYD